MKPWPRRRGAAGGDNSVPDGPVRDGEEKRCQPFPHLPFHIPGKHAHQQMGPYPVDQPVMHGTDLQADRLEAAEGALNLAEVFVCGNDALSGKPLP